MVAVVKTPSDVESSELSICGPCGPGYYVQLTFFSEGALQLLEYACQCVLLYLYPSAMK